MGRDQFARAWYDWPDETASNTATMVHAEVRLCARALPVDAGCLRGPARARSGAEWGIARPRLRHLPALDPRVKKEQAGHHRRYRREEPRRSRLGQWPWPRTRIADMVINLTGLGAVVIAFDVVFAEPDRLNPDIAARYISALPGRDDAGEIARRCQATTRFSPMPSGKSRVVLGESGVPRSRLGSGQVIAGDRICDAWARIPTAFPVSSLRGCCATSGAGEGGGRPRLVHHRARARRHRAAGADGDGWRRATRMPALSFEMLRVLGGSGTIMIKADECRHRQRRSCRGFVKCRPTATASSGCIIARTRSVDLCLRRRRAGRQGAAGNDQGKAGPDRHVGHGHERHQDDAGVARDARRRDPRPGAGKRADGPALCAAGPWRRARVSRRPGRSACSSSRSRPISARRGWSPSARCSRPG